MLSLHCSFASFTVLLMVPFLSWRQFKLKFQVLKISPLWAVCFSLEVRLEGRWSNSCLIASISVITFRVVGPLLGGFLNKEENIKPFVKLFPIFHAYPYLFPLVITSILILLTALFVIFFCKETLPKIDRLASHAEDLAKWGSRSAELKQAFLEENSKTKPPTGWSILAEKDSVLMIITYSKFIFLRLFWTESVTLLTCSIGKLYHVFIHHDLFGGCYKPSFNGWF